MPVTSCNKDNRRNVGVFKIIDKTVAEIKNCVASEKIVVKSSRRTDLRRREKKTQFDAHFGKEKKIINPDYKNINSKHSLGNRN